MSDQQTTQTARQREALRQIIHEAASARAALCENELVIRLDNILALAKAALDPPSPTSKP